MIKNIASVLAAVSVGFVALGACGGDDKAAGPSAAPSSPASAAPTTAAPSSGATTAPEPTSEPTSAAPQVGGSQVIMIDPSGKKYARKELVQMAAGMGATFGDKGAPAGFCARSYREGIQGGGKFPAGKQAFIDACEEGLRLAG